MGTVGVSSVRECRAGDASKDPKWMQCSRPPSLLLHSVLHVAKQHRITERFGLGPQGSRSSNPTPMQSHQPPRLTAAQAAQGPILAALEHLQGWTGIHSLSGQLFQHLPTLPANNFPLTAS